MCSVVLGRAGVRAGMRRLARAISNASRCVAFLVGWEQG